MADRIGQTIFAKKCSDKVIFVAFVGYKLIKFTVPPTSFNLVRARITEYGNVWWQGKERMRDRWQYIPRLEECAQDLNG